MKCPRCQEGELFVTKNPYSLKNLTKMHENCPKCHLRYERETGFFYGAMYISSILNMLFFVITTIAYYAYFIDQIDWRYYIGSYLLFTLLIAPLLYRFSRSVWLQIFYK